MEREHSKSLIVIAGPTAVGKTSISIRLALDINSEIISCDSRQFYREMNIGTAKPTQDEMAKVKHYFINNLSIHDYYSAGKFEMGVTLFLDSYFAKRDYIIMVGGAGLYMNAVCKGINQMPQPDMEIREEIQNELNMGKLQDLLEELEEKDPDYYKKVDKNNPKRIVRALEVIRQTGKTFSGFRNQIKEARNYNILKIGIDLDREVLFNRINYRMDHMISIGLFEEAKKLYPFKTLNSLQTVGYKEIFDHLDGHYSREEAIRILKRNSRRYAKRQITWFKKDTEIQWFHHDHYSRILETVKTFLSTK